MNKLIVIGYVGMHRCYLNVPREEAIARYEAEEGKIDNHVFEIKIKEIEFKDEFGAYDIWSPDAIAGWTAP